MTPQVIRIQMLFGYSNITGDSDQGGFTGDSDTDGVASGSNKAGITS